MDNPFEMYVTDGRMRRRQPIGGISSAKFTPRHLAGGAGEFTLFDSDPLNARLLENDSRVIIRYAGEHLMSGKVRAPSGDLLPGQDVKYTIQDDWRWLTNTLAWVNPGNPLKPTSLSATVQADMGQAWLPDVSLAGSAGTIQGQTGYYRWPTSARMTESVVKNLIRVNFDRLNTYYAQFPQLGDFKARNYQMAADLARGVDHVTAGDLPQVRFGTLESYIVSLLTAGGLGLQLAQGVDDDFLSIDTYVPKVFPRELTVPSGTVVSGSWSKTSPNATHAVVGGPGDLAARMFDQLSIPKAGDTTTRFPDLDVIEVFKDATSGQIDWPGTLADAYKVEKYAPLRADVAPASYAEALATILEAAVSALDEGAASSGVSVALSESEHFRYGGPKGIHVGDTVTISSGDSRDLKFTDTVTEATLELSQDKGLVVTPVVGEKKLSPNDRFSRSIVKLARVLHTRSASK